MGMLPFVMLILLLLFSNMVRIEFHLLNLYDGRGGGGGRRPTVDTYMTSDLRVRCWVVTGKKGSQNYGGQQCNVRTIWTSYMCI